MVMRNSASPGALELFNDYRQNYGLPLDKDYFQIAYQLKDPGVYMFSQFEFLPVDKNRDMCVNMLSVPFKIV